MTIEVIEQAAKTIVQSAYEYETALKNNDKKKLEQTKNYMLKICHNINILVEEERKNV